MPCSLPFHAVATTLTSRRLSFRLKLLLRLFNRIELKLILLIQTERE